MKYVLAMLLSFSTLFSSACGRSGTGRNQILLVSDNEMNQMGEDAYAEILAESRLSNDWRLNREVQDIGQRIAAVSGQDFAWEFAVLEDDQANAFCLPGGKVAVYTGLVPFAQTNAGLAAVMGHEIAHAIQRHAAERVSQNLLVQSGLALASLSFHNSEYKNLIAAALGVGTQFGIELPFNRFQESEADRLGLELMAKAGYDPREAVALWDRMNAGNGARLPEILSTHPDPGKRARELEKHMDAALRIYANAQRTETWSLR